MAKATLREQLEEAQATAAELKALNKQLDRQVITAQSRTIEVEKENNELRDRLMEALLQQEHMRGYMLRTAEDEPRDPLPVPPERRYASGPANEITEHFYDTVHYNGRSRSDELPRRWYHR